MLRKFASDFPLVFAGIAIGVMLMAVLQRYAPRLRARLGIEDDPNAMGKRPPMKVLKFRIVRDYRGDRR